MASHAPLARTAVVNRAKVKRVGPGQRGIDEAVRPDPIDWEEGEWLLGRLGSGELRFPTPWSLPWRTPSWHLWTGDAYAIVDLPVELVADFAAWMGDGLVVRLLVGVQWNTEFSLRLATSAEVRPSAD